MYETILGSAGFREAMPALHALCPALPIMCVRMSVASMRVLLNMLCSAQQLIEAIYLSVQHSALAASPNSGGLNWSV